MLVVPGHGDGARSTAGVVPDDYQHAAALALARHGFVTLTPELRGFGMLAPKGVPTHRAVAAGALESGTSYKAVVVKDLARALTVLQRWPGVDASRVGVAGASLGGELAVLLGVLDERVKVVASQSYGGAIGPTERLGRRQRRVGADAARVSYDARRECARLAGRLVPPARAQARAGDARADEHAARVGRVRGGRAAGIRGARGAGLASSSRWRRAATSSTWRRWSDSSRPGCDAGVTSPGFASGSRPVGFACCPTS